MAVPRGGGGPFPGREDRARSRRRRPGRSGGSHPQILASRVCGESGKPDYPHVSDPHQAGWMASGHWLQSFVTQTGNRYGITDDRHLTGN